MNKSKMIQFCKDFVSMIPETKKTKTNMELRRTVIDGIETNPDEWFKDKQIEDLYKGCIVSQNVYKFVRDNQRLFSKIYNYIISVNGSLYSVESNVQLPSLQKVESSPISGWESYDDEMYSGATISSRIYFSNWNIFPKSEILKNEFFDSTGCVQKQSFEVFEGTSLVGIVRGAFILELYDSRIILSIDHIDF